MHKMLISAMLLVGIIATAQENGAEATTQKTKSRVGINTDAPDATLHIKETTVTTTAQGVMFPKFSSDERGKFTDVKEGTMIFNDTEKCLEIFSNGTWSCVGSNPTSVTALSCDNASISPATGVQNTSYAGTATVAYTGGNEASYTQGIPIASTGVTGLTATLQRGTLGNNGGNLIYNITGTPSGAGNAIFPLNFGGKTCTLSLPIEAPATGSADFTNASNEVKMLYFAYQGTIIQDKINNSDKQLTIEIPYTNGQGTYNTYKSETILTEAGQDGKVKGLSLSIPKGTFARTGKLTATIAVDGDGDGEYLVKQMEPGESYTIATIPVTINNATTDVVIKGYSGIPDKKFNVPSENGKLEHQFIYIPIKGPDGRTWLSNNLGADYANINSEHFNPLRQAGGESDDPDTIKQDYKAYGSLFEWGRDSDGHELITWESSTVGKFTYSNKHNFNVSDAPRTNEAGDPCPTGYHTPTYEEQLALFSAIIRRKITRNEFRPYEPLKLWNEKELRLTTAGFRKEYDSTLGNQGDLGVYWSKTKYADDEARRISFSRSNINLSNIYLTSGYSIRCIKS